ncbi:unnamed protein product [Dicrocoelium dendriticum]|nr:unnamed protein product [Dicrocoelium dendriticum]
MADSFLFYPACALFPAIVVFGANYDNPDWMPYPKFNWPSWSYGCAILANFSSIFTSVCFGLITRETKRDLEDYTMEFPMSTRLRHRRRWWPHKRRWAEDAEPFENQPPDDHRVPPVGDTIPLSELSSTKTSEQREYSGSNSGLTYPESIPGSVHEPPHSRTYKGRSDL